MVELRRAHRDRLAELEDATLGMGARVVEMLRDVMASLRRRDTEAADEIIRRDDMIDRIYDEVERGLFDVLALQAPVASDLRLVSTLLHATIHLERMGDLCVNIAKFVKLSAGDHDDPDLISHVEEMSVHAGKLVERCIESLARRDLELVRTLPELDDPLDKLNKQLFRRVVQLAGADESRLDSAMRLVLVARYLERMGDHAVDIGEQVVFLVTGERVELASNSPAN